MEWVTSPVRTEALSYSGSMTLTAAPGSGKTTLLAKKIQMLAESEPHFCGIVLSYTVKASAHLKNKCHAGGLDLSSMFFGTIDKFCIANIVLPFGNKVTNSNNLVSIIPYSRAVFLDIPGVILHPNAPPENYSGSSSIAHILEAGYAIFENNAATASYILKKSKACKLYLSSKFTHVIIDEYQDCSQEQHDIFMSLHDLGLTCIAAGDTKQSIFKFAKKDPKYLMSLLKNDLFKNFSLVENYRSDPSIVAYAENIFTKTNSDPTNPNNCRVIHAALEGAERDAYRFIQEEKLRADFSWSESTVGVLLPNNKDCVEAAKYIPNSIVYEKSELTDIKEIDAAIINEVLTLLLSGENNSFSFAERYSSTYETAKFRTLRLHFQDMQSNIHDNQKLCDIIVKITQMILQRPILKNVKEALSRSLELPYFLQSFSPPVSGSTTLTTYHKAKGLEFDVVFLTGLRCGIFPYWGGEDYEQKMNLYYVGVTRAKKRLYLCNTKYYTFKSVLKSCEMSPFINLNDGLRYTISCENFRALQKY